MKKAHNRIELDEKYIIAEYISGRTAKDIAKELSVSKQVVLSRLEDNGIERRKTNPEYSVTKDELYHYYVENREGIIAIAKRIGCGKTFINNKLHEYGIPVRQKSSDPAFSAEERRKMYGLPLEKSPQWKGGLSKINCYLRAHTHNWRMGVFIEAKGTCFISGMKSNNLEAHHSIPFSVIRDEAFDESGIERRELVSDYTNEELDIVGEIIRRKHEGLKGYAIDRDLHSKFHSLYGDVTTEADLLEFKTRYRLGELNEKVAI